MQVCRFFLPGQGIRLGRLLDGDVFDLTASGMARFANLAALLEASVETPIPDLLEQLAMAELPVCSYAELDHSPEDGRPHLLAPVDHQEIWAAGVTYAWSREARVREAKTKEIYVRVYEDDRPELFFKCIGEKAVGHNDWIGLRGDSHWNVPEPELVLLVNPAMEIVGYTIGNDVSSRDIEGENPLYLPQAKIYRHSCALGPVVTLADGQSANDLAVAMTISRGGKVVFEGETTTAKLHRRLDELVGYLARYNDFPHGVLLLTGTGIVPGDDFTLQNRDEVHIKIDAIGVLRNVVKQM
jgi:2-dehydro-3-deoxy-D-arabinonate dehydratase